MEQNMQICNFWSVPVHCTMENFNLEMERFFDPVDPATIILTIYCKASNESYGYPLSTGTLWSEIDQVV